MSITNRKIKQLQHDLDETFNGYVKIGYHDEYTGQEYDPYGTYYLYIDDNRTNVIPVIINELRDEQELDIAIAAICGYVDEINYINSHSSH